MIEKIKELNIDDAITIDCEEAEEFTNKSDFFVKEIRIYSNEECEIIIVNLEELYLVIHLVESVPQYFVYDLQETGTIEDLIEEGYNFMNDDDDFRKKILINEDRKKTTFKQSELGAIYGLNVDRDDTAIQEPIELSICEYNSNNSYITNIFIEKIDDMANIFLGFKIEEDSIRL